ncbi:hypothetical protein OBBRIDRAFT_839909 [Obba rivulosa]|uniref:DUF6535 domain-containing protein n=1 Tax=Obba rivulosa TaxID=1052685 RepID=A0A8E2AKW8_9APHY|nr:hypothetical protein OBBRIDRAFT_839909 [Obba rivulosa]
MDHPSSLNSDKSPSALDDGDSNVVPPESWLPYDAPPARTFPAAPPSSTPYAPGFSEAQAKGSGAQDTLFLGPELSNAAYATMKLTDQPIKAEAAKAWIECAERIKEYDDETIQAWKEEIDMLLVFAGLFSAVVTAFNIQFIQALEPDSAGMTVQLLINISQQLNNQSFPPSPINPNPSAGAASSSVRFNTLWFASLILSLAAASIGILVKQWLGQYSSGLSSTSRNGARIRQFRYDSLHTWRVIDIMTLMPVLLLGALVLFLAGLMELLWTVQNTVAIVTTILASLLLLFTLITTILPTFVADCAYQSPQALLFFLTVQTAKQPLKALVRFMHSRMQGHLSPDAEGWFRDMRRFTRRWLFSASERNWYSWSEREDALVQIKASELDRHLLATTDIIFRDSTTLETIIRPCLADLPADIAIPCFYDIFSRRANHVVGDIPYFNTYRTSDKTMAVFADITLDMLVKSREKPDAYNRSRLLRILKPLLQKASPKTIKDTRKLMCAFLNDEPDIRQTAFDMLREHYVLDSEGISSLSLDYQASDIHAILRFAQSALADSQRDRQFILACNLIVFIVSSRHLSANEFAQMRDSIQELWTYLREFFEAPNRLVEQWMIPALTGLVPRVFDLARREPQLVPEKLVDTLIIIVKRLDNSDVDRNWEDMMSILRRVLHDYRGIDIRKHR